MRALSIIPALVSVPAMAQTSQRTRNIALNWNRAVAAERSAKQAMEQFYRDTIQPVLDAFRAGEASMREAVEAEDSERAWIDAYEAAAKRLVETPAPNLEAVVAKLRIGNRYYMFNSEPDPDLLLEKIADEIMLLSSKA
ncbi:hypothetical protein GS397_13510 [Sphingobium yanoikuyae]|uniref:Uncharacterized protein n=1 Tax=Sphingobium yanoikuyae TaxID=13690 RepID=A0A6P1GI92_SPHYA|nr:hypothetical protein [Sphingobium yanoikuyae]QHD67954.1 hypothetical protein GS397_13510 [Sphingobium yanoikuyae]